MTDLLKNKGDMNAIMMSRQMIAKQSHDEITKDIEGYIEVLNANLNLLRDKPYPDEDYLEGEKNIISTLKSTVEDATHHIQTLQSIDGQQKGFLDHANKNKLEELKQVKSSLEKVLTGKESIIDLKLQMKSLKEENQDLKNKVTTLQDANAHTNLIIIRQRNSLANADEKIKAQTQQIETLQKDLSAPSQEKQKTESERTGFISTLLKKK